MRYCKRCGKSLAPGMIHQETKGGECILIKASTPVKPPCPPRGVMASIYRLSDATGSAWYERFAFNFGGKDGVTFTVSRPHIKVLKKMLKKALDLGVEDPTLVVRGMGRTACRLEVR